MVLALTKRPVSRVLYLRNWFLRCFAPKRHAFIQRSCCHLTVCPDCVSKIFLRLTRQLESSVNNDSRQRTTDIRTGGQPQPEFGVNNNIFGQTVFRPIITVTLHIMPLWVAFGVHHRWINNCLQTKSTNINGAILFFRVHLTVKPYPPLGDNTYQNEILAWNLGQYALLPEKKKIHTYNIIRISFVFRPQFRA